MTARTFAVLIASVILLLSVSWTARTYLGRQRCAEHGMLFDPGAGCVPPPGERPIILERGLKRT